MVGEPVCPFPIPAFALDFGFRVVRAVVHCAHLLVFGCSGQILPVTAKALSPLVRDAVMTLRAFTVLAEDGRVIGLNVFLASQLGEARGAVTSVRPRPSAAPREARRLKLDQMSLPVLRSSWGHAKTLTAAMIFLAMRRFVTQVRLDAVR